MKNITTGDEKMMTGKTATHVWTLGLVAAAILGLAIAPADAGLIGHWTFDDGAGTTAVDSSGNGYDLSQVNADGSWVAGKAGGAYNQPRFTADIADSDALNLAGGSTVTLSMWVTVHSTNQFAGVAGFEGTGSGGDIWGFKMDNADHPQWTTLPSHGPFSANDTLANFAAATGDGWVHLVGVFEQGVGSTLYVNGVSAGTGAAGSAIPDKTTPGLFRIGTYYNSNSYEFNGAIDDVQVYDQALAPADVAWLYANPGLVFGAGPTVSLSANAVASNAPPGTLIGTLDFSPDGPNETFTFAAGAGDTDNGKFDIVNTNELRSNQYLPDGTYDIRIEGDDGAATTAENTFTITASAATYAAFVASAGVVAGTPVGGEVVATLEARDSDGSSIGTFGIVGGRDDLFQISGNELQQKAGADPGAPATIHYVTLFADGTVDGFVIVAIEVGAPPGTVIRIR
jgi:hypothetical protein